MLQCLLCSLAPPPAKVSGSHQNTSDYVGTANYAGTAEWAQLDLQSIQHRDHFGHLSILKMEIVRFYAARYVFDLLVVQNVNSYHSVFQIVQYCTTS